MEMSLRMFINFNFIYVKVGVTMLSTLLGITKGARVEEKKPEEKPAEEITKSASFKSFLSQPETQTFINQWNSKIMKKTGVTGRALVTGILELAYTHQATVSDKEVVKRADDILDKFAGSGRLDMIARRFKAMPERILSEIKSVMGGKPAKKTKKAA